MSLTLMSMASTSPCLQPPLTSTVAAVDDSRKADIVELVQEDKVNDEMAGDDGKPWHFSTSLRTHARHTPPSLTDPGWDGDGPSAKYTVSSQTILVPGSQVSLAGPRTSSAAVMILYVVCFLR